MYLMRNLFILIVLLITQLALSQTTLTKQQKKTLCQSLTAKKVLDISKGLSHEKELDSVVKNRDSVITELKQRIKLLNEENKNYTETIVKLNNFIMATSEKVDDISEKQIKYESRFWKGLHLHIRTSTAIPDFNQLEFKTDLTYEFKRWNIGIEATTQNIYTLNLHYTLF